MSSLEEKAREAFTGLLAALSSTMDKDRVGRIEKYFHPQCSGFGTAHQEIFKGKKEWQRLFEEELNQIPLGMEVTQKWSDTFMINDSTVGLMAETAFRLHVPKHDIIIEPTRMSVIFTAEGDHLLISHFHVSYPLGEAMDEIFPGSKEPRLYEDVTVLFTDFVGFTNMVATVPARKLLSELNELFARFDEITEAHGLTKIKTVGDAYMAIAGLQDAGSSDHALRAVKAVVEILDYLAERNAESALKWDIRAGIHSGAVIGGTIGRNKLQFDVWGDTVNIANRLQATSEKGRINLSAYTYELVKEKFSCEYRGKVNAKGKGEIDMYFLK